MKLINGDIKAGLASGFSPCCIAYFLVRNKVNKWIFKGDIARYNTAMDSLYAKIAIDRDHWEHVPCPVHKLLSIFRLYVPTYHRCEECGWQQLAKKECTYLKVHETEVRSSIRDRMLSLQNKYSRVYYSPSIWGRIGEEVAKEIGYVDKRVFTDVD